MSLNSGSASGILQGSRYNRGAGTAGTGATHASTVDTGSVLRIETNKTNGIILYCQPETTVPSVNAEVQVTLLTAQSTNRGGAFVAPRVGDKIVWLTSKGNSFYLGMSHQATSPHPFLGDTDVDATTGGTNTGGASMLMTGMRIADQPLGTTSDDPLPIENAQVDGAPGTGFANVPGSDVLMDPKTNTFRSVGEITGNASPNEPYDIPDSVFENSSSDFKTVMQALNKAKDPAYTTAKGFGFNEISTRSRLATVQGGSGSTTGSSTAKSGTSPTNYGGVIPPGAKQSPDALHPGLKTNPETYTPGEKAGNNTYKPTNPGGAMVYGQDYVDLWSTKTLTSISAEKSTYFAGSTLWIEAGEEIVLQVGDSSITINQDGIAIGQRELGPIGSSFKMSNDSIEAFSVSHEISAWTYDVSVPWATMNLSPMNAVIAACQGVEIKSGFQNFAPFAENLAEFAIQMTIMAADMADASGDDAAAERKDLGEDMADETIMAVLGVPVNVPISTSSADSPLSVPPGFAALDIMGPALGMITAITSELKACTAGKGGSATVKLNNADVTIQGGYIEQIPEAVIRAMKIQTALMAMAAGASIAAGVASQHSSFGGSAETDTVVGATAAATILAAIVADTGANLAAKAPELPLLIAGSGNVRIEASGSLTSGAYLSAEQMAEAADGRLKEAAISGTKAGPFPLSVGGMFNIVTALSYAKHMGKTAFVGVAGVGPQNSFLYHNLQIQNSAPLLSNVTLDPLEEDEVIAMTNILLEGPEEQEELDERLGGVTTNTRRSKEHTDETTEDKTVITNDKDNAGNPRRTTTSGGERKVETFDPVTGVHTKKVVTDEGDPNGNLGLETTDYDDHGNAETVTNTLISGKKTVTTNKYDKHNKMISTETVENNVHTSLRPGKTRPIHNQDVPTSRKSTTLDPETGKTTSERKVTYETVPESTDAADLTPKDTQEHGKQVTSLVKTNTTYHPEYRRGGGGKTTVTETTDNNVLKTETSDYNREGFLTKTTKKTLGNEYTTTYANPSNLEDGSGTTTVTQGNNTPNLITNGLKGPSDKSLPSRESK